MNLTTRIRLREDGITALNLQDISLHLGGKVEVIDFSPCVESHVTGADWEWWFLGQHSVFGAAVQAKCLSSMNDYDIGYIPNHGYPQIERLLDYSIANSIAPLYCFYNWWSMTSVPHVWPCGSYPKQDDLWGCALADGWEVYNYHLAGNYSASTLAAICEPWHCIVCCSPVSADPSERAHGVIRRLSSDRMSGRTIKAYKGRDIPGPQTHDRLPQRVITAIRLATEGNIREAALAMGENAPRHLLIMGDLQRYL